MIYILSLKTLRKKIKKLAYYKDYMIVDATKDIDGSMHKDYSYVVTVGELCPPDNITHYYECKNGDDDEIDFDAFAEEKIKKFEKNYLEGHVVKMAEAAIVESYINLAEQYEEQKNIFIVLGNKEYKYFGIKLKKSFNKNFDTDINFVRTFEEATEDGYSIFEKDLSDKDMNELSSKLEVVEKRLEEESKKYDIVKRRGKKLSVKNKNDGSLDMDYDDDDILFDFKKSKKKKKKDKYSPDIKKYLKGLDPDKFL